MRTVGKMEAAGLASKVHSITFQKVIIFISIL
jgi:hypothetical protein